MRKAIKVVLTASVLIVTVVALGQVNQAASDFDTIRNYDRYCMDSGKGFISNVTEYESFVTGLLSDQVRKRDLKALMDLTEAPLDTLRARFEAMKAARDAMVLEYKAFEDHLAKIHITKGMPR